MVVRREEFSEESRETSSDESSESIVASRRGYGSGASDRVEYSERNAVSVDFF